MTSEYDILNTGYQQYLISQFKFELTSFIGRNLMNKKPPLTRSINLLNIACGLNKLVGWVNADFYCGIKFWKKNALCPDWMVDLRYPLNCNDNVWDGVFSEHTLEHLYPNQVLRLLKEIHRIMKKGAWLRISVPDLAKYIDYYSGRQVDVKFSRWMTGGEAIRCLTQNYFHLSVWDVTLLSRFLKSAGFSNVREVEFMMGAESMILKDNEERRWESLYVEAQKIC